MADKEFDLISMADIARLKARRAAEIRLAASLAL